MSAPGERLRAEALQAWGEGAAERAIELATRAIGLIGPGDGEDRLRARLLIDRSTMLVARDRFFEGEADAHAALLLLREGDPPELRAAALEALAVTLFHLEAPQDAVRCWEQAAACWRAAAAEDPQAPLRIAVNIATAWYEAGAADRAVAAVRAALALEGAGMEQPLWRAAARTLVRAALDRGEAEAGAFAVLDRLIATAGLAPSERVVALGLRGSLAHLAGRREAAREDFCRAESAAQDMQEEGAEGVGAEDAIRFFADHAELLAALEEWDAARGRAEQALGFVEAALQGSLTRHRRARLLRRASDLAALGALAASRCGDVPGALALLSRGHAVELGAALKAEVAAGPQMDEATRRRALSLSAELLRVQAALAAEPDEARRRALRQRADRLLEERHAITAPGEARVVLGR